MSYTPVVRWRNFKIENVKTILELFPDMLVKADRNTVVNELEKKLSGYKATAYQFACQAGIEARKEHFTVQNYLYALDDTGLEQYLGFWFKMYVCPNPYVRSDESPICPFQVIARKVLNSPALSISFTEFFNESFGAGQSVDIFKNALTAWGKPLRINGDAISVAPEDIDKLENILIKVENTLPMKNNKDVDEFFERFSCENFMAFYDLSTIDSYTSSSVASANQNTIFDGFEPWLTSYDNPDYTGKEKYAGYPKALSRLVEFMQAQGFINDADLNDTDIEKFHNFLDIYNASDVIKDFDEKKLSSKAGGAALKKYIKYIEYLLSPHIDAFDYEVTAGTGENKIFFGTPGCGKSYHIEHDILGKSATSKKYEGSYEKDNIIRTTFYQDYSNTDFVGQILPKVVRGEDSEKDTVEYIFNPGPFTLALIQAISNPTKKVALVIEEINRGNAPAIFGDIFQLLDRDEDSISEYGIVNVSLMDYLNNYEFVVNGQKKRYKFKEIRIPGNMDIFATMNTSDQNVYTLDTAFVRRWEKEKIKNTFDQCAFASTEVPGMPGYTWEAFVNGINSWIAKHLEDLQVNEDKQIGVFFVKESLLASGDAEKFAFKVFDYLWSDVAKLDHGIFFNPYDTLEDLIAAYPVKGVDVFKPGVFK